MVFSSHVFIFYFLALALAAYYALPVRGRVWSLTLMSYLFYGWANPLFMVLMLASTLIDYAMALVIAGNRPGRGDSPVLPEGEARTPRQRRALALSVCSNLALLGFFKYFNFATENYDTIVQALGLPGLSLDLAFKVTLPLGISFYTFQSMSYTIDVYRGHAPAQRQFIDFACYVSMFPQLVAGPIIRYADVAAQIHHRTHTLTKFARGVSFFAVGTAKKILLANPCGKVADLCFDAGSAGFVDAWTGAVAYAFQIYFDFSAYSDMAIGLGLMAGFVFAKNFDSPYRSRSITEFWHRWHISLSSWLRDYLYIPLGGNRKGAVRTYVNLALVMLLGGLWHGASWNFIVWGAIHGGMLVLERLGGGPERVYRWLPGGVRVALTFVVVLFSWVFFRAADLGAALTYCGSMLGLGEAQAGAALLRGLFVQPYYLGTLLCAAGIAWGAPQTWDWTRSLSWPKAAAAMALFWVSLVVLSAQAYNPFIYFIF
ncbi:MAG: MBOAT family O-acyltransferase [Opitutaceae bacterium]